MLSIFLMILKVIGILLLVIIGLFLTVLLVVLFVPLRIKGQGSYYGKPAGFVNLSWLFHIISVKISYQEQPETVVRLFGFRILKGKTAPEETEEETDTEEAEAYPEEPMVSIQEVKPPVTDPKEEKQKAEQTSERISHQSLQPSQAEIPVRDQVQKTQITPEEKVRKKSFFERILNRIRKFADKLVHTFKAVYAGLRKAGDLKQQIMAEITDAENKKTVRLIIKQAKKVIRHVLPRKLKGQITFGFDDPYTTGQILTGAALFYPAYRDNFTLQPIFDRQIIEGEIAFKGRIRLCVFAAAGLKILLNKNFRVQLKKIMNRGGM